MYKINRLSVLSIIAMTLALGLLCIYAVSSFWQKTKPLTLQLSPISFQSLPYWKSDNISESWPAFIRSCKRILSLPKDTIFLNGQKASDWHEVCTLALKLKSPSEQTIRTFFETHFTAYKVTSNSNSEGLFTGYYEPQLLGSKTQNEQFQAPIYKRPSDLVMIEDLSIFRKEPEALKGMRIAGRVINGNLRPYYTHTEIDQGALKGNELLWVEDPVDAFFVQIQGSAAIKLNTGETTRLSYHGTNGHPYTPIGRVLVEKKLMKKEEVSMQSIREWLKNNPAQAKDIMLRNESFVFFSEITGDGPVGAQGVVLTPGRSLAVDPAFISYGTPIWLDAEHPLKQSQPQNQQGGQLQSQARIQRLVIAQDKGGAIKGHIRGDLFWGTGNEAGELAGLMKSKGSYYVLLPKQ